MKIQLTSYFIALGSLAISQEISLSTGKSISDSNGSASYSVGQVTYKNSSNLNGEYSQGVQQPHEYFILDISENKYAISVSIYPNPAHETLTIEFEEDVFTQFSYHLTDLNGKILFTAESYEKTVHIDMRHMAPGSYILQLRSSDEQTKTYQIIKN